MKLTEAGRRLFDLAYSSLKEEQQALEDIGRIKKGGVEVLSLALNSTINRYYAPALLSRYCAQNPGSRLKVTELPSRSIIYTVLSDKAELGIGPFQHNMAAFDTWPLYSETRSLVIGNRHPYIDQIMNGHKDYLKRTPLVTSYLDDPEMRPANRRIRDSFAAIWEISSLPLRIHMVDQGLAAAYIDSKSLEENPACAQFHVVSDIPFGSIERLVGVYCKGGKRLSKCAGGFIQLCLAFWQRGSSDKLGAQVQ